MATPLDPGAVQALVAGEHRDPFSILGPHAEGEGGLRIRAFVPGAREVAVVGRAGGAAQPLSRIHEGGLWEASIPRARCGEDYRLRITHDDGRTEEVEDPYRFPSTLSDYDLHLLGEGTHYGIFDKLGAHPTRLAGVDGVLFSVWAPNARRVSVVGDWNGWDGRRQPMRLHPGNGIWELFVPGTIEGQRYKFEILSGTGALLALKSDPLASCFEPEIPRTAAQVRSLDRYRWRDESWMAARGRRHRLDAPLSIYEVHLGSWRRRPEEGHRFLSYRELAGELADHVTALGFTHVQLLPVMEHPFYGSWGYQTIGYYAPTRRYGEPEDLMALVDELHQRGIGVLLDWVPAHVPQDPHGLAFFDGTHLYEHADPRLREQPDWGTRVFNFGRNEVANFMIGSALHWLGRYHADGLRVDAVAAMLYRDYSRKAGEWLPNEHGGRENLEAIAFIKRLNEVLYAAHPDVLTVAEESTAWPAVSRPTWLGGLGFGLKWNMGWMHDVLDYMRKEPVYRRFHHNQLTFGLLYAWTENFVLPLSHDEVVYGKRSLLSRMPGDDWQRFANLRLLYGFMWAYPGKKLLFMGGEFGQVNEWDHEKSLDWHLLDMGPYHRGVQQLVGDLNRAYREEPALHELDCEPGGFAWIDCADADQSVLAFVRYARDRRHPVVCVLNFTPVPRRGYRVGVPGPGQYVEMLNTDGAAYGGSNVGNGGVVASEPIAWHGQPCSVTLTLPPLAALLLRPRQG
ncbi:MAG: 1,4-alpha-glucan branching protein GlgB [Candidatus Rokubacteria bacterium]|nr:1,4-alpha-glucan branching protein GlgB [Candidatus Rokubacteria bacterium]